MFVYGLSMVIARYTLSDLSWYKQPKYWGFLVALIILTILGTFVQVKYMPEPNLGEDKDNIMHSDHAKGNVTFG